MNMVFISFENLQKMSLEDMITYVNELKIFLNACPKKPENHYLETLYNFGTANGIIAERVKLDCKKEYLVAGISALKTVLKSRNPRKPDILLATLYLHLGNMYCTYALVESTSKFCKKAIEYHNKSLSYFKRFGKDDEIGDVNNNLGNDFVILALEENLETNCKIAINCFNEALESRSKEKKPIKYAETQNNLGNAYRLLCRIRNFPENSQKAIEHYSEALSIYEREGLKEYYRGTSKNYQNLLEFKKQKEFKLKYLSVSSRGKMLDATYEVFDEFSGSFGTVYLAFNHSINAVIALKTYKKEFSSNLEVRKRFLQEAQLWIELGSHPNILRAHAIDEINNRLYILMDYIPQDENGRKSLKDYIGTETLDIETVLRWGIEFCLGMEYANNNGIKSHGDIKPSNVLITPIEKRLKISDFGIANIIDFYKNHPELVSKLPLGTAEYMAPEIFLNPANSDIRSDIYSFGIVLYEIVTRGGHPFIDFSEERTSNGSYSIILDNWARIHHEKNIPPINTPLEPVIKRCLEKNPDNRYHTFRELRSDLERIYKNMTHKEYIAYVADDIEYEDLVKRGMSFDYIGKYEYAIRCYEIAIAKKPMEKEAYVNMAFSLVILKKASDAIFYCDKALEIDSDYWIANHNKGNAFSLLGLYDEALACFDKALERAPWNTSIIVDKALCLNEDRKYEQSLDCCNDAIDINSKNPRIYNVKGLNYFAMENFEKAIDCFTIALKIEPHYTIAMRNKGLAHVQLGEIEDAIKCFLKILELDPHDSDALKALDLCIKESY